MCVVGATLKESPVRGCCPTSQISRDVISGGVRSRADGIQAKEVCVVRHGRVGQGSKRHTPEVASLT